MNVSSLMTEYFNPYQPKKVKVKDYLNTMPSDLPVKTVRAEWEHTEYGVKRVYFFDNEKVGAYFGIKCIQHTLDISAKVRINILKEKVEVFIYTPSTYVTEIEKSAMEDFDYLANNTRMLHAEKSSR